MAEVDVQIAAPPVNIDELLEFIYELRQAGFVISPQQITQAHNLLITLAAHGYLLDHPQRLATYLAPVLCSTPEEQEQFYQRFKQWLGRQPLLVVDEVRGEDDQNSPEEEQAVRQSSAERQRALLSRLSFPIAAALFILIIAVSVWVMWGPASQPTGSGEAPAAPTPTQQAPKATPASAPTQTSSPGSTVVATPTGPEAAQPTPTETPNPTPLTMHTPYAVASRSASTRYFDLLLATVVLPLLLVSVWLSWRALRRWQLERWRSRKKPELRRLPVKNSGDYLFIDATFRRLSQELRRHRLLVTHSLDAVRTVESTVRAGGMFTPLYGLQRFTPDYLVLIDRRNYRDQQAGFDEEITARLKREGVFVHHYYFDSDPRLLLPPEPLSPYLKLQDLMALHNEHRLIIFSDGEGLINPLSGEPHRWLEIFSDWPFRVILTPELYWAYREQALAETGFIVLPADDEGLAALMEVAHSGRIPSIAVEDTDADYPTLLLEEPQRWLSERVPEEDLANQLMLQLRYYLGNEGFYLLAACAVYPELLWNITSYYGYHLISKNKYEETFRALVRLPWMRRGRIPDWLRSRLIAGLPPPREKTIRQLLEQLLISSLQPNANSFELEVAQGEPAGKRFLTGLKSAFNGWRRGKFLRDFIRTERGRSPLRDYVFLSFMSGSKLAVAFPAALRKLLYRQGQPILGLRRERVFLFAALVSLGALGLTLWNIGKLPQTDPVGTGNIWGSSPSELPRHTFSPWNGARGNQYTLVVRSLEGEKCDLQGAALQTPSESGITLLSNAVSSDGCQLESQISIATASPLGYVDLSVLSGDTLLERLSFEVTETPQPPLPQFTLSVMPSTVQACSLVNYSGRTTTATFTVAPTIPEGYALYITDGQPGSMPQKITTPNQTLTETVGGGSRLGRYTYVARAEIDNGRQRITIATSRYDVYIADCPEFPPPPTPPPICPTVVVSCPSTASAGGLLRFEVVVIGGDQSMLKFNWTVSSGSIDGGQETNAIVVHDPQDISQVTATVVVGGLPPSCNSSASCTTAMTRKSDGDVELDGPVTIVVPNLLGKSRKEATILIENAKLRVGTIKPGQSSTYRSGYIMAQSPDPGQKVPVGTVVNLVYVTVSPPDR